MTSIKIKTNWETNNIVSDGVRIYKKTELFNSDNLPQPLVEITDGSEFYEDLDVIEGQTYFYMLSCFLNKQEVFTECFRVSTSSDPNAAFLTNHLNFETSSLFDKKTGSNWSTTGSISYVPVADKIALSIAKPSFISAPGVLSASSSFTAVLDITFLNEPTFTHQAIMSIRASNSSESIDIFRVNGSGIAVYKGPYGVVGSGVNLPNNIRLLLKIVKKSNGTIKFFINDALINTQNFTYNVESSSHIQIGYNHTDPSRGLNAVIHEFKYYHGKEID